MELMPRPPQAKAFLEVGAPLLVFVAGGFWGLTYILEGNNAVKASDSHHQISCADAYIQ